MKSHMCMHLLWAYFLHVISHFSLNHALSYSRSLWTWGSDVWLGEEHRNWSFIDGNGWSGHQDPEEEPQWILPACRRWICTSIMVCCLLLGICWSFRRVYWLSSQCFTLLPWFLSNNPVSSICLLSWHKQTQQMGVNLHIFRWSLLQNFSWCWT